MNSRVNDTIIIEASDVFRTYSQGILKVEVLKGINFKVETGTTHAIVGASGAGKSTLMHLLGGLDRCSQGKVCVAGQDLEKISEAKLGNLRNKHLGFIYQFHHLLPEFTALENIAMPLVIRGESISKAKKAGRDWLENVKLTSRADHKPGELSGGERQRIALARALVTQPDCLLADEPTGNLDTRTALDMLDLMMELNRSVSTALVIVTHDLDIASRMEHIWKMDDGHLNA
ncbi:MAG: lipoprotein-releasing system ATP-binding protein [Gammaproteobacteria bacterium]|jgi:lipoprotein-releasing system ATP-binding protein